MPALTKGVRVITPDRGAGTVLLTTRNGEYALVRSDRDSFGSNHIYKVSDLRTTGGDR